MGHNLSIDKYTTSLDDILNIDPAVIQMLITSNIKVTSWIS